MKAFREELQKSGTALDIMELLLEGVKSAIEGREPNTIHVPPSTAAIATAQEAIGWDQLLRGRLSKEWQKRQQKHLGAGATRKNNGQTWSTSVSKFLLEQWLQLW